MKLATGIDLIEIERIRESIACHGEKFLARIYTPRELEICAVEDQPRINTDKHRDTNEKKSASIRVHECPKGYPRFSIESLAARFAAKEAVAKALGTGIGAVSFQEIEILRDENRAPVLYLHGAAQELAEKLGLETWSISISHTETHAIAMVVAIGE